jgi:membrane protein YqaA with SNARE-associated domain
MLHSITAWATTMPPILFVLVLVALVFSSSGGFPFPVTGTILVAGMLAMKMPASVLLLGILWLMLALGCSLRDLLSYAFLAFVARWMQQQLEGDEIPGWLERMQRWPVMKRFGGVMGERAFRWTQRQLQSTEVGAARELMYRWHLPILALSRLTPVTPLFNIAASLSDVGPRAFWIAVYLGRLVFVALWLLAGAISGQAILNGAGWLELVGIIGTAILVLIIVPGYISRRVLAQTIIHSPHP